MKVGFMTFEQFHSKKDIASSRIRAKWLTKYWPEAEEYLLGQKYDVLVFQKVYYPDYARMCKSIKILDVCDGDFLDWGCRMKETIDEMDAVVTSTQALADVISTMTDKPVVVIPDRMDLEFHTQKKVHEGQARSVVWFGYSQNQKALETAIPSLIKLGLNLIVISDKPFPLPINFMGKIQVTNYPWSIKTVNDDIIKGDMVVNPQYSTGHWKYKSPNKTLTAWALGMPVADTPEDLVKFMDPEERIKEANKRLEEVKTQHDVRLSVAEYKALCERLMSARSV